MAGKLFKAAKKLNPYATTMDDTENLLGNIKGYVSTGSYAINAIFSADMIDGGVPKGRITTLFGPSQAGKSLISTLCQISAQDDDMDVVLFDTEADKDGRMESSFGGDLSKTMVVPVESIQDLEVQSTQLLDEVIAGDEKGKYLFVVDSLGFLATEKQFKDAAKGESKADQGAKAKAIRQWLTGIRMKVAKSECAFILINHETAAVGQTYESIFKNQGGGHSIEFVSSIMANISAKKEKQDKTNEKDVETMMTKGKVGYTGQNLRIFTQKNRCAIPHKQAEVYLNFATGIDKYSGLDTLLENLDSLYLKDAQGNIGKGRTWYLKDGDEEVKLGSMKEWKNNEEVWQKILPQLNEIVKRELAYRSHE
jgi:RecA/RadA recombinase